MDTLPVALRRVRRRLTVQQWIGFIAKATFLASALACVWLFLTKLFPMLGDPVPIFFGLTAAGVLAASVLAILRRPSLVRAALEADERLTLHERLTSSYELAGSEGPMVDALHRDARAYLQRVNIERAFPYLVPRYGRWLVVPLLVFGLANMLLPEFDLLGHREREAEARARAQAVRVKADRLKFAVRPLKQLSDDKSAALAEAAGAVERVAERMEAQEINEKQALAKLTNLSKELVKQREQMRMDNPVPKLAGDTAKLGMTRDIANDIQRGKFEDAANKTRKLLDKMKRDDMDRHEREKLADELKELSEMLGGKESKMGRMLAEAAESLDAGSLKNAVQSMSMMELSLDELASVLEQLGRLDLALAELADWQRSMLGPSEFCRFCGMPLKPCGIAGCKGCRPGHCCFGMCSSCYAGIGGMWAEGEGGIGGGMGFAGHGRGGMTGELPDVNVGFTPALAPGAMTKGKLLANILQRSAPDEDAEATVDYVRGAFVQIRQEAEQALTKEEIPPGSKEFVRQYFGSIEPDDRAQLNSDTATSP